MKKILFPIRWVFTSYPQDEVWINKFADAFGSIPGFKLQTIVMLGWTAIVCIYPQLDPNMFHLMAALTIYSAITQPMIAIQNARSTLLMIQLLKNNINQMEAMADMIRKLQELEQQDAETLEDIAEAVEEGDLQR